MSVQITPKSTQHTGMAISTEGSVAAWQVPIRPDLGFRHAQRSTIARPVPLLFDLVIRSRNQ